MDAQRDNMLTTISSVGGANCVVTMLHLSVADAPDETGPRIAFIILHR